MLVAIILLLINNRLDNYPSPPFAKETHYRRKSSKPSSSPATKTTTCHNFQATSTGSLSTRRNTFIYVVNGIQNAILLGQRAELCTPKVDSEDPELDGTASCRCTPTCVSPTVLSTIRCVAEAYSGCPAGEVGPLSRLSSSDGDEELIDGEYTGV